MPLLNSEGHIRHLPTYTADFPFEWKSEVVSGEIPDTFFVDVIVKTTHGLDRDGNGATVATLSSLVAATHAGGDAFSGVKLFSSLRKGNWGLDIC